MTLVWICAIVIFGVAEALTQGLVSIWFVGGATAALVAALLHAPLWLQAAQFLLTSAILLALTRFLAGRMRQKTVPTNADRVLRRTCRVTETVDNTRPTGTVYIDGKTWTARSEDGSVLAKDSIVEVVRIEGVKLFVTAEKGV